jgi:hypothetical protein
MEEETEIINVAPANAEPKEHAEVKEGRGKNWSWHESYTFLQLIRSDGKNWSKVLNRMHSEKHIITHIQDPDKLRVHYNGLKSKKGLIWKEYLTPKLRFSREERSSLTPADIKQREAEHAYKHQLLREQREHARAILKEIEERENLKGSAEKEKKEILKNIKEKDAERKEKEKGVIGGKTNTRKEPAGDSSFRSELNDYCHCKPCGSTESASQTHEGKGRSGGGILH